MILVKNNNITKIYLIFLIIIALIINPSATLADKLGGVERIRECSADNSGPHGVGDFDEMHNIDSHGYITIGKEMEFSLSNSVCMAEFATIYTTVKIAIAAMNGLCGTGSAIPRPFPSPIQDSIDLTKAIYKVSTSFNRQCALGLLATTSQIGITFGAMGGVHFTAKGEYENVSICGSDWEMPDKDTFTLSTQAERSYYKYLTDYKSKHLEDSNYKYEKSKEFRELIIGGKEFDDNPNDTEHCKDPSNNNEPQKYYMRGTKTGIFLCEKYNPINYSNLDYEKKQQYQDAYNCCLRRSRNYICLEKKARSLPGSGAYDVSIQNQPTHVFCKANSKCTFDNNKAVIYEAYRRDNNRLICAKSYSLCPFNFAVGGGTIYPDYYKDGVRNGGSFTKFKPPSTDSSNTNTKPCEGKSEIRENDCSFKKETGKLRNYCQYYRHCTVVNPAPYNANFDSLSPYFSKACINFIGDSQNGKSNGFSYDPGIAISQQSTFSAPIVQCIKETMENIFTNRAGHSRCTDGSFGDLANICRDYSGQDAYVITADNLVYKIGNKVKQRSLFETLQIRLKNVITSVLVLSVMFFGVKILMAKVSFENRKEILVYLVKIAFVIYFVNGDAWKSVFFDGIYNGSNEIAKIFFKINSVDIANDKCNFGAMYDEYGAKISSQANYPPGKNYLMIWDTLDCKIMQYLNFGPTFSGSTILLLIIAGFFTGGVGIILSISVFIFAFSMIALTIRAIHIFVSSAIAIIIYVFVSPIIIPLVLFERTKSIFDTWLSHLMSFTLQPIILFSYLAIFITLSEKIIYNGAIIENNKMICAKHCRDKDNNIEFDLGKCGSSSYGNVINPLDNNVACIFGFQDYGRKTEGGQSFFGISSMVALDNILKDNGLGSVDSSNRRIMLILKSALFLYILLQFVDEISGITSTLIGENIDVKGMDGFAMLKKFREGIRSVQKRGARFIKIQSAGALSKAQSKASEENKSSDGDDESSGGSGFTSEK